MNDNFKLIIVGDGPDAHTGNYISQESVTVALIHSFNLADIYS